MNLSGKSTIKGLAFTLVLAMLMTMVPMLPGIGQVDQVYADAPDCITSTDAGIKAIPAGMETSSIYASGKAITISQGAMNAGGGSSTTLTSIYVSSDGAFYAVTLAGIADGSTTQNAIAGYDLSGYYIYGGAKDTEVERTSITMTGGWVNGVYGGGWNVGGTVSGSTEVNISGGTVVSEVCGGGNMYTGDNTQVNINGNTEVNISGGTFCSNVYGGGKSGKVSGSAVVNISGGTFDDNVYGGGSSGAVSGGAIVNISGGNVKDVYGGGNSSSATVSGGTEVNISGGTVFGDVYGGGGAYKATVSGSAIVNISGGVVTGNVNGDGRSGKVSGTTAVAITGGSIMGTVNPQSTNGSGDAAENVYKATLTLLNTPSIPVTDTVVTDIDGASEYGLNGVKTNNEGKIGVYLTSGTSISTVTANGITYAVSDAAVVVTSGGAIGFFYLQGPPTIITETLEDGTVGTSYSKTLSASGTSPITWSAMGLPEGLSIDETTGVILGTPTSANTAVTVTVSAFNALGSTSKTFTFAVEAAASTPTTPRSGGSSTPTYRTDVVTETEGITEETPAVGGQTPKTDNGTVKITGTGKPGNTVVITITPDVSFVVGSIEVKDDKGKPVNVTENPDGTYSYVVPAANTIVDVTYEPIFGEKKETPWHDYTERSRQKITLNGAPVSVGSYNIDKYNYFKLRDLALILNGTGSMFGVEMGEGNSVILTPGQTYTPVGGELVIGDDMSGTCVVSEWTVIVNGIVRYLDVYNVGGNVGGNNYFKLRDLGELLNFDVDYDPSTDTALITAK